MAYIIMSSQLQRKQESKQSRVTSSPKHSQMLSDTEFTLLN